MEAPRGGLLNHTKKRGVKLYRGRYSFTPRCIAWDRCSPALRVILLSDKK